LGDATGEGDELREQQDGEGCEFAADEEEEGEDGEAAGVVGCAGAEEDVGPGGRFGGEGAEELIVGPDLAKAGFVEG
jgi:hypothetical protein